MKSLLAAALVAVPVAAHAEPVDVVATFPILADMVQEIGGDRVAVHTLVPPGGDVHVYEPTPQDAIAVARADLVVVNGLGFEGFLDRLVDAAGGEAKVVVASAAVTPLPAEDEDHDHDHAAAGEGAHEHAEEAGHAHAEEAGHEHAEEAGHGHGEEAGHGHDHGAYDPHAWQSVANARAYVAVIADALAKADPAGAAAYEANAARYDATLAALDAEVRAELAPLAGRVVLTSHDSLGYLGHEYRIEFLGAQGLSTDAEPSARDIAAIVRRVRSEGVDAVFVEAQGDRRVVDQIAAETGATVGEPLFVDTLSPPDGPAATYVAMMKHNAAALTAALGGAKRVPAE